MLIFFYIILAFLIAYGILFEFYRRAWNQIPLYKYTDEKASIARHRVSIVIPARNEEENISNCLRSLLNQSYPRPLIEIIVVNDHSTDRTAEMVQEFRDPRIRLINLADHVSSSGINSYKKKAIETAIDHATGDWIMCTDADCCLPPGWISAMVSFASANHAFFVAAPVKIRDEGTLLSIFQSLDFTCMQGITGAVVHKKIHCMCNGANLGYDKKIFLEIGGFSGIEEKASGDDMLLMQKFYSRYPKEIFFQKCQEATVSTIAQKTWKSFIRQRMRWSSKATSYDDRGLIWNLLFVFLLNLQLLAFFIACFWYRDWMLVWLTLVLFKTVLEFPFMLVLSRFFMNTRLLKYFLFLQPLHIFYMVIAGILGNLPVYEWKGRKVK